MQCIKCGSRIKSVIFGAFLICLSEEAVTGRQEAEAFVVGLFDENPFYEKVSMN